jgi:hypothetical protein
MVWDGICCDTLCYTTLHYTTLHYTTLHYTTLHYTTLQSIYVSTNIHMHVRTLRFVQLMESFGAGTAAVICPVKGIIYQGQVLCPVFLSSCRLLHFLTFCPHVLLYLSSPILSFILRSSPSFHLSSLLSYCLLLTSSCLSPSLLSSRYFLSSTTQHNKHNI